jgi:hypothetical protein
MNMQMKTTLTVEMLPGKIRSQSGMVSRGRLAVPEFGECQGDVSPTLSVQLAEEYWRGK